MGSTYVIYIYQSLFTVLTFYRPEWWFLGKSWKWISVQIQFGRKFIFYFKHFHWYLTNWYDIIVRMGHEEVCHCISVRFWLPKGNKAPKRPKFRTSIHRCRFMFHKPYVYQGTTTFPRWEPAAVEPAAVQHYYIQKYQLQQKY